VVSCFMEEQLCPAVVGTGRMTPMLTCSVSKNGIGLQGWWSKSPTSARA